MWLCCVVSVPLLVHGQVSPLLENAHVFARQRPAGKGVVGPVFGLVGLLRRGRMALEIGERIAAAVLALHRGRVVVPVRQVGIAGGIELAVSVGLDLDALGAGALVVVVFALGHGVVHSLWAADRGCCLCECLVFSKKLCARLS
jgi:hypothetical protein